MTFLVWQGVGSGEETTGKVVLCLCMCDRGGTEVHVHVYESDWRG